jgi:exoribonuclease II
VLMAYTASSRKLDCKAMIRCFTSGITGYSLVLLMKLTVEFWSLFS